MIHNVLIQIVSEQSMPNLLAAMALNPAKIIHICSKNMPAKDECLKRAYKAAGLQPELSTEHLSSMPEMAEVRRRVGDILAEEEDARCILNFTCGTKLMAIASYVSALHAGADSLYVDTRDSSFIDGRTGPGLGDLFPGGDTGISSVAKRLRVDIVAVSNGCGRVTGGKDWKPLSGLAEILLDNPRLEKEAHQFAGEYLREKPRRRREREDWEERMGAMPLQLPEGLAEPVLNAGLCRMQGGRLFLRDEDILGSAEEFFKFFQGTWWEVAVIEHLEHTGRYRDLRWSANAGARSGNTDMEEDILGLEDVNLLYVSCKRGGRGESLSRTLEEIASSASRIGGSHNRKMLAIYRDDISAWHMSRLQNRADELDIKIITRNDLLNFRRV